MSRIDPASLSRWFDAHAAVMVLYARQWLDDARAEDVVQDAFVRLMCQASEPRSVRAWLFAAVRNAAVSELRSRQRWRRHEPQVAAERPAWFRAQPEDLMDAASAQAALLLLPAEHREVVILRIWAGMTLQEIAGITGHPISTLFSRYKTALAQLRERMESPCTKKKD